MASHSTEIGEYCAIVEGAEQKCPEIADHLRRTMELNGGISRPEQQPQSGW